MADKIPTERERESTEFFMKDLEAREMQSIVITTRRWGKSVWLNNGNNEHKGNSFSEIIIDEPFIEKGKLC